MSTISDTTNDLAPEIISINLSEMAEKPAGAWPKGWYPSEVIEGYQAGSHLFTSGSSLSRKGDSQNMIICLRVTNGDQMRTMFKQINYRAVDFSADRITTVKNLRKEFAGVRGKWQGYEDEQRSSLALGQLGQIQNATGAPLQLDAEGVLSFAPFLGTKPFVRLTIDEETGYNEITGFSKYPGGVEPKQKKS